MASRQIFLPETPEAVSREWLSDVLGGEIIAVSQTPLGDGQGFMGDILLLDIVSEDSQPGCGQITEKSQPRHG